MISQCDGMEFNGFNAFNEDCGLGVSEHGVYPLVICYIAIENMGLRAVADV